MIATYCDWHLGDHLIHLNYLRKLAWKYSDKMFVHAAGAEYLSQLREVVEDIENIAVIDLAEKPPNAVNAWKDRLGDIAGHPLQYDWVAYYVRHFDKLSHYLGVENPMKRRQDFLFDYPRIRKNKFEPLDFLIVNSTPHSGQLHGVNGVDFDRLIDALSKRHYSIMTTAPVNGIPCTAPLSVSDIGGISLKTKYIVGIATGPIWPTFNIWNHATARLRLLLLNRERVLIAPNTEHAENMSEALGILQWNGLI